ncbi:MAG: hypothetical protein FWG55_05325 [Candidatus Bathyarchaeota archaeon]|nr:hypothetical protein [Candidatus Termiticorpusculum sp.]
MLSSLTVDKLKVILIIDLIIVGVFSGAYFYLQSEGIISGSVKPATFVFTDLVVNPVEAFAGQPVQVLVNVTNIGGFEGETIVDLEVNGVVVNSVSVVLAGLNTCEIIEFIVVETNTGVYTVKVGDLSTSFLLNEAPPNTSKIVLSNIKANPYEVWPGESITISATAKNPSSSTDSLMMTLFVDDVLIETKLVELAADATTQVEFVITASYEGLHKFSLNTLSSTFTVVPEGYHTLIVTRVGGGSKPLPFTLNGEAYEARFFLELLPVGEYTLSVSNILDVGTGILQFASWNSETKSSTVTFMLKERMTMTATYDLLSGYASCPSLYIWNGTGYTYVTDVSNAGWLGYTGYINPNGEIIFSGGNPYDYVKLDKNILTDKNGYFDIVLSQQWDELFYMDYVSLLVVDHPIGTDVYTSMTNYLNKGYTGQIYTTATGEFLAPVSAINEKGENVLDAILWKDGNFTPGVNGNDSPTWNNVIQNQLTLDFGDLSGIDQIKLVVTASVDWGPAETYYEWISKFETAASMDLITENTPIVPKPTLEILTADGVWVEAPQDRQIPLPSDYTARTFAVDLTGLFPNDTTEYKVRFTNFWNVTYNYIGIDITPQQDITIISLKPTSAKLDQFWDIIDSESTGAFTRYGDVTMLLQEADDIYVIGRQGDRVNLQFYIGDFPEPAEGMERDYFFAVACWFKDPPNAWGYGFTFTVDPMPFLNMTGFPYTDKENYPYDTIHLTYLSEYNTRIIS